MNPIRNLNRQQHYKSLLDDLISETLVKESRNE